MRRTLMAVLASATLALLLPAVAAAHHSHHHGKHARTHTRHASGARLVRFGAPSVSANTTPTLPIPRPPGALPGSVVSFENGVLTLRFTEGPPVSGRVTQDTHRQCQTATPPAQPDDDQDGGGGDDEGGSESGGSARQHGEFTAHSADTQGGESGDEQDSAGERETCTESMLKPGTGVLAAELKLSSAGPVWERVDIAI